MLKHCALALSQLDADGSPDRQMAGRRCAVAPTIRHPTSNRQFSSLVGVRIRRYFRFLHA
jgi:hypothetical protein